MFTSETSESCRSAEKHRPKNHDQVFALDPMPMSNVVVVRHLHAKRQRPAGMAIGVFKPSKASQDTKSIIGLFYVVCPNCCFLYATWRSHVLETFDKANKSIQPLTQSFRGEPSLYLFTGREGHLSAACILLQVTQGCCPRPVGVLCLICVGYCNYRRFSVTKKVSHTK